METVLNPTTGRLNAALPKRASKDYDCAWCLNSISKGEAYYYVTAFFPKRICIDCVHAWAVE
jgi:hypothetical protein